MTISSPSLIGFIPEGPSSAAVTPGGLVGSMPSAASSPAGPATSSEAPSPVKAFAVVTTGKVLVNVEGTHSYNPEWLTVRNIFKMRHGLVPAPEGLTHEAAARAMEERLFTSPDALAAHRAAVQKRADTLLLAKLERRF
jgi:hypothetical protein